MAIAPIFIFLSLCIINSQEASVSQRTFENIKPINFLSFDNNLGTYIEYKGQVEINVGFTSIQRVFWRTEEIFIFEELFLSGYKALTKHCKEKMCLNLEFPSLKEFNDTFDHLSTFEENKNSKDFTITVESKTDILRMEINSFLQSDMVSITICNIVAFYRRLEYLSMKMKHFINNLLGEIKCARLNSICPSNKRTWNDVIKYINYTLSDDYLKGVIVNVGKLNNDIVFDYKIPEIDKEQFSIYRLTPIPKVHRNGTIEILNIDVPYLAVNNKTDRYFALQDLEDCLKLESNRYLCKPNRVSKVQPTEDLPCDVAVVRNQSTTTCTSHLVVRQSLWTPLLAPNSWMATVTKEAGLLALCTDDDDVQELQINGSGILRMRSDCTARLGTSVKLQGQHRAWKDSHLGYASLQTTTEADRKIDSNQLVRDAIIKLKEEHGKLETIEHPYVIGAAVVLAILLFVALLYCQLRPRPRNAGGLNDAYQQLRVHFSTRSGKAEVTGE